MKICRPLVCPGTTVLITEHYKRLSKLLNYVCVGLFVDDTKNWTDENWTAKSLFSLYMAWNILGGEVANICSTIINTFLVLWKKSSFQTVILQEHQIHALSHWRGKFQQKYLRLILSFVILLAYMYSSYSFIML